MIQIQLLNLRFNIMITAWQISSTLQKMQQFIRFIEGFDEDRSRLQKVLPLSQRIKRVSEQREMVNRQMNELSKGVSGFDKSNNALDGRGKKQQQGQKYTMGLVRLEKQLNMKLKQCSTRISRLKRQMVDQQQSRRKYMTQSRQMVIKQMQGVIQQRQRVLVVRMDSQVNQMLIQHQSQQQQQLHSQTVYGGLIGQMMRTKLQYQFQQQAHTIFTQHMQLGEIKCKLNSLQDRRRKLLVNRLFTGNKMSQKLHSNSHEKQLISNTITTATGNIQHVESTTNKKRSVHSSASKNNCGKQQMGKSSNNNNNSNNYHSVGLIQSIMSMFSTNQENNHHHQNNSNHSTNNKGNNDKALHRNNNKCRRSIALVKPSARNTPNTPDNTTPHHHQQQHHYPSLPAFIPDDGNRLRVAQILAQIYQFEQHFKTIVEQNIIFKLYLITSKLHQLNQQVNSYTNQLLRVGAVVIEQIVSSMSSIIWNHKPMTMNQSSNTSQQQRILLQLRQNKQIQFFLHFIAISLSHRHKLITTLFIDLLPAISTTINFINNRLIEISNRCCVFSKGSEGQKQTMVIQQQLYRVKAYVQSGVQGRLMPIREVLQEVLVGYVGWIIDIIESAQQMGIESVSESQEPINEWDEIVNPYNSHSQQQLNEQMKKVYLIITAPSITQYHHHLASLLSSPQMISIHRQEHIMIAESLLQAIYQTKTRRLNNNKSGFYEKEYFAKEQQNGEYQYQRAQSLYFEIVDRIASVIVVGNNN